MATYLLTWNPLRFDWWDIEAEIAELREVGWLDDRWSCGNNKSMKAGDRFYLMRLGNQVFNKGIVGSGTITSRYYEGPHWDDEGVGKAERALFIDIRFDMLLDAELEKILEMNELKSDPILSQMHWSSQTSGIRIPDVVADELQKRWSDLLAVRQPVFPIEDTGFTEGHMRQVHLTIHERNVSARQKCIEHYGTTCAICGIDFGQVYGPVGEGYIHVHHITPLSEIGQEYEVNPITDLVPVCPNCHAMIHRRLPCYSIEEVQSMVNREHGS